MGNGIDVFDPITMDHVRYWNAPVVDARGLAVAANGDIFVADWYRH